MKTTPVIWKLTTTITTSRNTSTFRRTLSPNNYIEISVDDLKLPEFLPFISAVSTPSNGSDPALQKRPARTGEPSLQLIILVVFLTAPNGRKQIGEIHASVVMEGIARQP